jgi:hypothetical protein
MLLVSRPRGGHDNQMLLASTAVGDEEKFLLANMVEAENKAVRNTKSVNTTELKHAEQRRKEKQKKRELWEEGRKAYMEKARWALRKAKWKMHDMQKKEDRRKKE